MNNSEQAGEDTTVQGLYSVFHDGPCGKHYQAWEQCVEKCRRDADIENLDKRCVADPLFTRLHASALPSVASRAWTYHPPT